MSLPRASLLAPASSLLLASVFPVSTHADTAPPATADFLSPAAIADFQCMDTLGFPALHGCPLVSVAVDRQVRGGNGHPVGRRALVG